MVVILLFLFQVQFFLVLNLFFFSSCFLDYSYFKFILFVLILILIFSCFLHMAESGGKIFVTSIIIIIIFPQSYSWSLCPFFSLKCIVKSLPSGFFVGTVYDKNKCSSCPSPVVKHMYNSAFS